MFPVCTRAACLQASAQVSRSTCTNISAVSWNIFTFFTFVSCWAYL
jgi:hypothetical protein